MRNAIKKSLLGLSLLFCLAGLARAQSSGAIENPLGPPRPRQNETIFGSPEEEIKYRASVRRDESSHREMVGRAKECMQLVAELRASFESAKSFGAEDFKKLEKVEKLARKIRGSAGGGDDDEVLKDPPAKLESAIARLSEVSGELLKRVEKTSRFVTSASVIERSNEVIELVRHIKAFFPK
jgi:hypothetical protein